MDSSSAPTTDQQQTFIVTLAQNIAVAINNLSQTITSTS